MSVLAHFVAASSGTCSTRDVDVQKGAESETMAALSYYTQELWANIRRTSDNIRKGSGILYAQARIIYARGRIIYARALG